jgi:hypothetical protein
MLALSTAERGDVAVRTDLNKSFILKGDDYSKLEDWQELLTPTDVVLSVDGRTGVVSLSDKYQPLDTDLTTIAGLTHSNRHVLISNGTNWTRRALEEADLPSLSISKITGLQTALDSKEPAISGTAYKVLSIQSDGSGVKTGCLRDLGNYAAVEGAERFAIIHYTDQAAISLQSQSGSRFWISSAPSVLNIGGAGATAPENGQLQIYHNSRVVIPSLPLLVGKTTATGGYKLEVEGNTLVNGTLKANNSFVGQASAAAKHYHDVLSYSGPSAITGTMKITMPKSWSSTIMSVTIKGYTFLDNNTNGWECRVHGYNSIMNHWACHSAQITGNAPFSKVRLAHDGTKCIILLGETSTVWNYPKLTVSEMLASQENTDGWETGWNASIIQSETGITNIVTPTTSIYGNSGFYRINEDISISGNRVNMSRRNVGELDTIRILQGLETTYINGNDYLGKSFFTIDNQSPDVAYIMFINFQEGDEIFITKSNKVGEPQRTVYVRYDIELEVPSGYKWIGGALTSSADGLHLICRGSTTAQGITANVFTRF